VLLAANSAVVGRSVTYLDDIENLLGEVDLAHGMNTRHGVAFVRNDSLEVRVTVFEPHPPRERVFNLTAGMTPALKRSIRDWFESVISPEHRTDRASSKKQWLWARR
jgi:hypothetical protein